MLTLFRGSDEADPSPLTLEEIHCVRTFKDWWGTLKAPRLIAKDRVIWGPGVAGTADLIYQEELDDWLVDVKTAKSVYPEHEIQLTIYKMGLLLEDPARWEKLRLGIIQVGFPKNKRGWFFTEVEYQPELYQAARTIWAKETAGQVPHQRDYPLRIKL